MLYFEILKTSREFPRKVCTTQPRETPIPENLKIKLPEKTQSLKTKGLKAQEKSSFFSVILQRKKFLVAKNWKKRWNFLLKTKKTPEIFDGSIFCFLFREWSSSISKKSLLILIFKNFLCIKIQIPESPSAQRVSKNIFPLQLFLFSSIKAL